MYGTLTSISLAGHQSVLHEDETVSVASLLADWPTCVGGMSTRDDTNRAFSCGHGMIDLLGGRRAARGRRVGDGDEAGEKVTLTSTCCLCWR